MAEQKLPKRVTTAVLQSLGAGVVPRAGLEAIAVGRKTEVTALLHDLDEIIAHGGSTFRLILGRYGSGKSFLAQLVRNYALGRNFVVADADLTPVRRLTGTQGQGLNLYRELLNNLSTKTRPDGNAFAALLERWISDIQQEILQSSVQPSDPTFSQAVERRIHATIGKMEGMVNGFDFANVVNAYWRGHQNDDDELKKAALRWLRGEFNNKTEARQALNVRAIIDDDSWYDYLKILATFVRDVGYKGLVIFIDEAVNLYKISNSVSRLSNYERLLAIFNDTLQGKAQYLGFIFGATPQMVEDKTRGLFSYEALRSRLEESRFAGDGLRDMSGPLLRLETLRPEEIYLLLQRIREIHGQHYGYTPNVSNDQIQGFMNETLNRLGTAQFLTPREVVRDFIAVLNLLQQHRDKTFEDIVMQDSFSPTRAEADPEALSSATEIKDDASTPSQSPYSSFKL